MKTKTPPDFPNSQKLGAKHEDLSAIFTQKVLLKIKKTKKILVEKKQKNKNKCCSQIKFANR